MDYGHPLLFGVFLTPSAAEPGRIVELVAWCDTLGLDLVTFQDHPYQPGFLETWTLLAYVAARTQHVRLAPNVANLPLRHPAVLARSVASLDRLTGGRVELGIGAGYFWDAVEGMGGRRLHPRQAVEALSEALDILRGLWDTRSAFFSHEGRFYSVPGTQPGPAPVHPISVWIGAYRPRMLRLIGQKGDGWLPSVGYLDSLADLTTGNQLIDEAAREAGRDPAEIRRLLNIGGRFTSRSGGFLVGPPGQWIEQLTALALDAGISAFVLASDDRATIERFARDVAPAVRERVEAERARRRPSQTAHDPLPLLAAGRWLRYRSVPLSPLIDYAAIPPELASKVVTPRDERYDALRSVYMARGRPGVIILCASSDDVAAALAFARTQTDAPLSIRSGGHGIAGLATNDGGIVIDLRKLNAIEVLDSAQRLVRIGAGATWGEVARALAPYGWAMTSGNYGDVGVGGLATAGGLGWLVRKHGLTIDHVVAVEVVLADGQIVRADSLAHPDLFWGMRGAGFMLGVATQFEFRVFELPRVVFAQIVLDASETAAVVQAWAELMAAAPRELTTFLWLIPGRRGQPAIGQLYAVVASDNVDQAADVLAPFLRIAPVLEQRAVLVRYASLVPPTHDLQIGQQTVKIRNGFLERLSADDARAIAALLAEEPTVLVELRSLGGANADVDPLATAFAHRAYDVFVAAWFRPVSLDEQDRAWAVVAPRVRGLYAAYTSDVRPERLPDAFPGETLEHLRDVKQRYDPANLFRRGLVVAPGHVLSAADQR
ncbi:LLM class flavin-dependent oxidoreductase [Thermorudis peleae]|uniref:LLM class flavin-dependent oxidoreductase n=1 Tax=Thermorudis peleae TaxID=1382356 RepID=UPI00057164B3|nr:LLM class flavin-dependent oxidoreductase [Thermorudis peleae]